MDIIHTETSGKGDTMPYSPNTPQFNDVPSSSQPQLLNNFQSISTFVNVNHVDFDLPDQGKHKWVSFPIQGSSPATNTTEVALFSKTSANTGNVELYMRKQNNGTLTSFTEQAAITSSSGWTYLPSGILMKWGTLNATGAITVDANTFGPAYTTLYSVQLTNQTTTSSSDTYVMGGVITGTNFDVYVGSRTTPGTPATANFNWLTIGV